MSTTSVSDPSIGAGEKGDGVFFTATRDGVQQLFLISREALEDLEHANFSENQPMLDAFAKHDGHISAAADKALAYGYTTPKGSWILLSTKAFG
jgi:hypothetical protein